jgi:DNA-binding NarL/FixJ family response regulator
VIRKRGRWKATRDAAASRPLRHALVIDADAVFRSAVRAALAGELDVIETANGTDGVREFRAHIATTALVLIGDALALLDADRTAALIRRFAAEQGTEPPVMLLAAASGHVENRDTTFAAGVVSRSLAATELKAALREWLPAPSPRPADPSPESAGVS